MDKIILRLERKRLACLSVRAEQERTNDALLASLEDNPATLPFLLRSNGQARRLRSSQL
ncbi:MAG: hypothetical protein ACR2HG_12920 [Pyrinomonadaceae bacterium]